jgi:excisionase family DNA binding protein
MAKVRLEDFGDVMTSLEVARLLNVSRSHVHDLVKEGKLRRIEGIGSVVRVSKAEVARLLTGEAP